ncbi:tetratricopeptide repeat protein [Paraburkholderia sp. EG287A]|uniref:tetratricopeptide repeat protein n=1 Tax=unclassified Paraburkholderia TaxID=2615204 RepID=UPI0034D2D838
MSLSLLHGSAYAALMQPLDVSNEVLRYRHNAQAIAIFGQSVSDNPEIPPFARSSLYFASGKRDFQLKRQLSAINNYTRSIALNATASAFNNRGGAYFGVGNLDAAQQDYEQALRLNPSDVHAWENLSSLLMKRKQFDKAIDCLSHAIAAGDQRASTYVSRGIAYQLKGDAQDAFWDYDVAIALAPHTVAAHVGKVGLLIDAGKLDEAREESNTALGLDPNDTDAKRAAALLLKLQHRYADAIVGYTSVLNVRPTDAQAFVGRAQVFEETGEWSKAIADYSRAITLMPDDDVLLRLRGLAYDKQGDNADAVADFEKAVRLAPSTARNHVLLARAFARSGQVRRSIDVLSNAIKLLPNSISLRHERAFSFEQLGDYASAVEELHAILEANAQDTLTRRYLADDETTLGQYSAAAHDYEIVGQSVHDDGGLLYGRAQLNFYTGQLRQADADLSEWQRLYRAHKIEKADQSLYAYVVIWRHIIALKLATDDRLALADQARGLDANRWPYPILAFYMGRSTAAGLLSAVEKGGKDHDEHSCEANAYLGEWLLSRGDISGAREDFAAASTSCPAQFIEKALATWELQGMSLPIQSAHQRPGAPTNTPSKMQFVDQHATGRD